MRLLSKIPKKKLRGTALLRLDFNTEDDWRMEAVLPTIKFLLKYADKLVIVSHKGRPRAAEKKLSLFGDAKTMGKLLRRRIYFFPHFNFPGIKQVINSIPPSAKNLPRGKVFTDKPAGKKQKPIFLLENLRFLRGEEKNSKELAKELASLADYYVNDAFAVSHRANASVSAITKFLPSYAGLEFEKEVQFLSRVMDRPKKPLVLILGGGKASDKLGMLKFFKNKAARFLLGGAPANTILLLRGANIGKSLADRSPEDLKKLKPISRYKNIVLPSDFIFNNNMILDIGRKTEEDFAEKIASARTIIWNGPVGLFEKKPYDRGSLAVARAIAGNRRAFSLAGGGETVMFLKQHGLDKKFSFISTGGGAMLEFLSGKKLPGILALKKSR